MSNESNNQNNDVGEESISIMDDSNNDMFIVATDLWSFNIYYRKYNNKIDAFTESEFKNLKDNFKDKCKKFNVKMKPLTWGLHNDLQEAAMVENESGDRYFNLKAYRESRIMSLLKKWDVKDSKGNIIPINKNYICQLAPSIPDAILRAYDERSFLNEDEEKNL